MTRSAGSCAGGFSKGKDDRCSGVGQFKCPGSFVAAALNFPRNRRPVHHMRFLGLCAMIEFYVAVVG